MKKISGNLVVAGASGVFDVIVHGCNCQCVMGAGVAKAIKREFPEAWRADLGTLAGDRDKLGSISTARVTRGAHQLVIVNAYTQFDWRGRGVKADYQAIRSAFRTVKDRYSGKRIGYPRIGAGLAGGDWELIASIIDEELAGEDHTLVIYDPSSDGDSVAP